MQLTLKQLRHAFLKSGYDKFHLSIGWVLINHAEKHGNVDLREALTLVRSYRHDVAVFVEHILQTSDIDDVEYIVELLVSDLKDGYIWPPQCLRMLQVWCAKTRMQIVIDKRNSAPFASQKNQESFVCD